jgi:lysozyme
MTYSKTGEALTERFESCDLEAYLDQIAKPPVWTIGYGHVGPEVCEGLIWTQAQADAQLAIDMEVAENCVNAKVSVALTQGEFDALCDFTFNLGCARFSGSTLLRLLNAGDYSNAAKEFDKWDWAGGVEVAGLLRRRQAETEEFEGI